MLLPGLVLPRAPAEQLRRSILVDNVQVAEAEDTTSGGLLLTAGSAEKPTLGKVRLHISRSLDCVIPGSALQQLLAGDYCGHVCIIMSRVSAQLCFLVHR